MSVDTGSHLATLRLERAMSQEELAEHLGVSRQAVSNWERSESLPDTTNLLRLSDFYGVTVDELIGRTGATRGAQAAVPDSTRSHQVPGLATIALCAFMAAAYYALAAPALLRSTVDDLTQVFSLSPSPTLAILWFAAEVIFVLAPFVLIAGAPIRMPRSSWLGPLAVLAIPIVVSATMSALGGAGTIDYSGIGGALMSSVAIKADALALLAGCVLADTALRRRAAGVVHPPSASS